jgi:hypothetical protein
MIYEALKHRLENSPGVVALATDGIFVLRAPQGKTRYVLLLLDAAPEHHTRGTAGYVAAELTVVCVAPTNAAAIALGQAVRQTTAIPPVAVLDGFQGLITVPAMGNVFIGSCRCRGWADAADLPVSAQQFGDCVSAVTFDLHYTEPASTLP